MTRRSPAVEAAFAAERVRQRERCAAGDHGNGLLMEGTDRFRCPNCDVVLDSMGVDASCAPAATPVESGRTVAANFEGVTDATEVTAIELMSDRRGRMDP